MQSLSFRKRILLGFSLMLSIAAMLACFTPAFMRATDIFVELGEKRGENKFATIPDFTYDSVTLARDYLVKGDFVFHEPKGIEDYIEAERNVNYYVAGIDKFVKQRELQMTGASQGDYGPYMAMNIKSDIQDRWRNYQAAYGSRWSSQELEYARDHASYFLAPTLLHYREPVKTWGETLWPFVPLVFFLVLGYMGAALCSNIYFVPVLRAQGYRWKEILWGELCSFNLPAANLAFPVMLPVFPWGNPKEHMQQAMRRVATALSLTFMHAVPSAVSAYAQAKAETPVDGHEITLVMKNEQVLLDQPKALALPSPTPSPSPSPSPSPTPSNWTPEVTVESIARSKYVGLNGAVFHNGMVLQSQITFSWHNGLYGGVWNSKSLSPPLGTVNFGNETDLFLGWSGKGHRINIDAGGSFVNVTPFTRISGDVLQLYLRAGRTFQIQQRNSIEPYVFIRHFKPVNGHSPVPGTFVEAGVKHVYTNGRLQISSFGEMLHDNGAFGFDHGLILRSSNEVSYALMKKFKILSSFQFSAPITRVADGRKPELVYGLGLRF